MVSNTTLSFPSVASTQPHVCQLMGRFRYGNCNPAQSALSVSTAALGLSILEIAATKGIQGAKLAIDSVYALVVSCDGKKALDLCDRAVRHSQVAAVSALCAIVLLGVSCVTEVEC